MPDTLTPNYKWTQPAVGGDPAAWGTLLNADLAAIDQVVFTNAQAGVPIGTIIMFGGATAPANWWLCEGASVSTTGAGAALFAVIGYAFGGSGANFNLPNLMLKFPLGADGSTNPVGRAAGNYSNTLSAANLPSHAHTITDVSHTHTIIQTPHTHTESAHSHAITDPQHSHTLPGTAGGGLGASTPPHVYSDASGGSAIATNPAATGITGTQPATATIQAASANLSAISASNTGITTTNSAGSGTPFNVVPPYVAVSFCIRFQ